MPKDWWCETKKKKKRYIVSIKEYCLFLHYRKIFNGFNWAVFFPSYQIPVKKVHIYDHWLKLLCVAFKNKKPKKKPTNIHHNYH